MALVTTSSSINGQTQAGFAIHASFIPLNLETRAGVETACAAFHLNRASQTLRVWACRQNGPIRPRRINGRLMWPVEDLRKLCGLTDGGAA